MEETKRHSWLLFLARLALAVLFLLLATAIWWLMPPRPRAILPKGSEILCSSPDGCLLATRQESKVTFWNVATGRWAGHLPDNPVPWKSFLFSPDHSLFSAIDKNDNLQLWEVSSGKNLVTLENSSAGGFFTDCTFSPDRKWFAFIAGNDKGSEIRVWDLDPVREKARLSCPVKLRSFLFSPDCTTLVFGIPEFRAEKEDVAVPLLDIYSGGDEWYTGRIITWDIGTGRMVFFLKEKHGPPLSLKFSPDGRARAGVIPERNKTVGLINPTNQPNQGRLSLFEMNTGQRQSILPFWARTVDETGFVVKWPPCIDFSPDGERFSWREVRERALPSGTCLRESPGVKSSSVGPYWPAFSSWPNPGGSAAIKENSVGLV